VITSSREANWGSVAPCGLAEGQEARHVWPARGGRCWCRRRGHHRTPGPTSLAPTTPLLPLSNDSDSRVTAGKRLSSGRAPHAATTASASGLSRAAGSQQLRGRESTTAERREKKWWCHSRGSATHATEHPDHPNQTQSWLTVRAESEAPAARLRPPAPPRSPWCSTAAARSSAARQRAGAAPIIVPVIESLCLGNGCTATQ
jgi:hypothetical protein